MNIHAIWYNITSMSIQVDFITAFPLVMLYIFGGCIVAGVVGVKLNNIDYDKQTPYLMKLIMFIIMLIGFIIGVFTVEQIRIPISTNSWGDVYSKIGYVIHLHSLLLFTFPILWTLVLFSPVKIFEGFIKGIEWIFKFFKGIFTNTEG